MNTIGNINSMKKKIKERSAKARGILTTLLAGMVALITATMSGSVYATSYAYTVPDTAYVDTNQNMTVDQLWNNGVYVFNDSVKFAYSRYYSSAAPTVVYITGYYNTNFDISILAVGDSKFKGAYGTSSQRATFECATTTVLDSQTYYYGSGTGYNYNLTTIYSSLSDAISAIETHIQSSNVRATSSKKVEAGNVAILDFGSGVFDYDLTLTSYNYQKSGLFQGANAWNENGQAYYWSFTLPESGDSVSGTQITWDKAPSNLYPRDALGQTHYGIAELSGTGAARYLLIINPYVNKISESGQGDVNGWINIDGIPEGVGVYIYPMQQTITGLSNENVISPTAENPGGYGVATSQGGIIDTTTIGGEAPYTQTTGGSNSSMPLATIGDYVEDINNTLHSFSQNFLNLLKAPIEYIKALVEGAQNFFTYIAGLFTWLPQDINAFVITGLMIVVIIGIFHSLL